MENNDASECGSAVDLEARFDAALKKLAEAPPFAKGLHSSPILQIAKRLLCMPSGAQMLYERAPALEQAGLFTGTDWALSLIHI